MLHLRLNTIGALLNVAFVLLGFIRNLLCAAIYNLILDNYQKLPLFAMRFVCKQSLYAATLLERIISFDQLKIKTK